MMIHTFSLIFSLLLVEGNSPNYYPNYMSAREASKTNQKELVVFFTDGSCTTCESAWLAFTNDPVSNEKYVCTRLDIKDFDGGVFYNHFEFNRVPAWAILNPKAEVEDKWEGGWKDANGKPVLYDVNVVKTTIPEEKKIAPPSPKTSPSPSDKISSSINKDEMERSSKENSKAISGSNTNSRPTVTSSGFILQAGYFGSKVNAEKMDSDLKSKGISAFRIESLDKDGTMYYRIITKMYNSESDAIAEQGRFSAIGIKTAVKQL